MNEFNDYPSDSDVAKINLGIELSEQVTRLASFILENVPGEPSKSEGAIDTAIRVIKDLKLVAADLLAALKEIAEKSNTTGYGRGALGVIARAAIQKAGVA